MAKVKNGKAFVLFGSTERDPDEHVLQFFPATPEGFASLEAFKDALPGNYGCTLVNGVDYDKFLIDHWVFA
jgi:hypothetical protein